MRSLLKNGLLCLLVLVSTTGLAAAQNQGGPEQFMRRLDSDGDGRVTREEFRGPPKRFGQIDANKDGVISREEIEAFRAAGGGGGQQGPNGPKWLTAEQLRMLLTGTEISHVSPKSGSHVQMIFRPDGSLDGSVGQQGADLTGSWRITDAGTICFHANQLGDNLCFRLVKSGNQLKRYKPNGQPMHGIDWTIERPGPDAGKVP